MQQSLNAKQKNVIYGICFYAFFINGVIGTSLGALMPFINKAYNLHYETSGLLLSAHSIGNLAASYVAALLPFYLGRKTSATLLSLATVLGFFGMILSGNPIWLFFAFLLTGIGRGSVSNFDNMVINEISDGDPKAFNILHSFFAVGALAAPFAIVVFTKKDSGLWRLPTALFAFASIMVVLLFSIMKVENKRPVKGKRVKVSYSFLKDSHFWVSTGLLFFYLCAETAINGWLVTYFKDTGLMTTSIAQMLSSLLWFVILFGRLTCAYLLRVVSKKSILLMTSIGSALFFVLLLSTSTMSVIVISIIGLGFCMSGIYPTTIANLGGIIKSTPMAMGMLLSIAGIGSILMPAITGKIAQSYGIFGGMSAITVAIVLNLVFSIANYAKQQPDSPTVVGCKE